MTANSFTVLLSGVVGIFFLGLILMKQRIIERVGEQGFILLCGYVAHFLVPALLWTAGLSSIFNEPNNPVLLGTGGYYGVNYEYFPQALAVYFAIPAVAFLATISLPKKRYSTPAQSLVAQMRSALRLEPIAYIALLIAILLTVWYFYVVGWD